MKCDLCNETEATIKLFEDDLKLVLNICQNCFDSEYSEHDFKWNELQE